MKWKVKYENGNEDLIEDYKLAGWLEGRNRAEIRTMEQILTVGDLQPEPLKPNEDLLQSMLFMYTLGKLMEPNVSHLSHDVLTVLHVQENNITPEQLVEGIHKVNPVDALDIKFEDMYKLSQLCAEGYMHKITKVICEELDISEEFLNNEWYFLARGRNVKINDTCITKVLVKNIIGGDAYNWLIGNNLELFITEGGVGFRDKYYVDITFSLDEVRDIESMRTRLRRIENRRD